MPTSLGGRPQEPRALPVQRSKKLLLAACLQIAWRVRRGRGPLWLTHARIPCAQFYTLPTSAMATEKDHMSVVICGHVDSGELHFPALGLWGGSARGAWSRLMHGQSPLPPCRPPPSLPEAIARARPRCSMSVPHLLSSPLPRQVDDHRPPPLRARRYRRP